MRRGSILIIMLVCIACTPTEDTNTFIAGVVIPLTGPASSLGEHYLNAMLLAKEELNSSVRLIIEDDATNLRAAISATQKVLLDDVDIVTTVQANIAYGIVNILGDTPLLASIVSHETIAKEYDNAFLFYPLPSVECELMGEFAKKNGFNKVAMITVVDQYGLSMKQSCAKVFQEVTYKGDFQILDADLRTQLLKATKSKPDAIFFIGYSPHQVNFQIQRAELGIDIPILTNVNAQDEYVKSQLDNELLKDTFATVPSAVLDNERTTAFRKKYVETYGIQPDFAAPFGYDMMLVLDFLSKQESIEQGMKNLALNGLNGVLILNQFGEAQIPLNIVYAENRTIIR